MVQWVPPHLRGNLATFASSCWDGPPSCWDERPNSIETRILDGSDILHLENLLFSGSDLMKKFNWCKISEASTVVGGTPSNHNPEFDLRMFYHH